MAKKKIFWLPQEITYIYNSSLQDYRQIEYRTLARKNPHIHIFQFWGTSLATDATLYMCQAAPGTISIPYFIEAKFPGV